MQSTAATSKQSADPEPFPAKRLRAVAISSLILFGLYLSSRYNYLLFHSLVELFSIVVACGIFIIAWNSRRILDNNYLLFLGIAYLFIAFLDLIHTLAYKGMPIFQGYSPDLATQLWIAARYMEGLSLLAAPLFLSRRLSPGMAFGAYGLATFAVLASLFVWPVFPVCFIEGSGLTPFKKISEYVISVILLGALGVLFKRRDAFDSDVFRWLSASILFTIAGELAFTFYVSVFGLSNVVGHFCKLVSYFLIYKAIIQTGLKRPYSLLFRNLKQKETDLKKSEERFRRFLNELDDGAFETDDMGNLTYVNRAAAEIPGKAIDELLNRPFFPLFTVASQARAADVYKRSMQGEGIGETYELEFTNGAICQFKNSLLMGNDGKITGVFGIMRDVTRAKQAEQAIRESETKFRTLFDTSPQAIALTETQTGSLLDVNETLCRISGYEKKDLIGKTTTELGFYSPEDRDRFVADLKTKGRVDGLDMDFRIKDGAMVHARMFAVPIQIEGSPFILTSFFDMTEQRRLEVQLERSQRMESIATLTGGIAHDYNNLLTIILGNIALARESADKDPSTRISLQEAEQASLKMRDLTHQLMTLSKGGMSMRTPGPIQDVLEETARKILAGSSVDLVLNIPEVLDLVNHDSRQLAYAIENVVRNAVEASTEGGVMAVTAQNICIEANGRQTSLPLKEGCYVRISVQDEGPGIPEAIRDKIFDPYFSTKPRGTQKGMGLGLSIAYAVVRNHGGHIDVATALGKGTTVSMFLPAWEATAEDEATPSKGDALPLTAQQPDSVKRVLVMDDEIDILKVTRKILERMGCEVETVAEGAKAIQAYKQAMGDGRRFACVILDLTNKIGMGGLDALKGLIQIDPGVRAIVSSGYFNDPVMADFKTYGFQAAIPKPYRMADFERAVKEIFQT
jgi:PAS domain S-box-containing protein